MLRYFLCYCIEFEGYEIVNNYKWFRDVSFIDFLRDVGKEFRIGPMLNRDIVKNRLEKDGL